MPTVFVIDDDAPVRRSMERLLRAADVKTETFGSAEEFLAREAFDGVACILLDVNMPGASGMELQVQLAERGDDLPIVFLTAHGDIPMTVQAMKRGATNFLTKPVDQADLLKAIHQAIEHHARIRDLARTRGEIFAHLDSLTAREREVMDELLTGARNKIVADHLGIVEKTVKVHRARVMEKMGVKSVAELVHLCHLVDIEPDN